jgi:hypothetical protein
MVEAPAQTLKPLYSGGLCEAVTMTRRQAQPAHPVVVHRGGHQARSTTSQPVRTARRPGAVGKNAGEWELCRQSRRWPRPQVRAPGNRCPGPGPGPPPLGVEVPVHPAPDVRTPGICRGLIGFMSSHPFRQTAGAPARQGSPLQEGEGKASGGGSTEKGLPQRGGRCGRRGQEGR